MRIDLRISIAVVAILMSSVGVGQSPAPLDRPIGQMQLTFPLDGPAVQRAILTLGQKTRACMGLEGTPQRIPTAPLEASKSRLVQRLDLSDLTLGEGLRLMFEHSRDYEWEERDGVVLVRPVPDPLHPSILDKAIPGFSAQEATVTQLLEGVHQLFDRDFQLKGMGGSIAGPPNTSNFTKERSAQIRSGMEKKVSINLGRTTVRGVLNAIVKSYGNMLWYVTYFGDDSEYGNCRISFRSYDNWSVTAMARTQK